jgi:hypothetical protein
MKRHKQVLKIFIVDKDCAKRKELSEYFTQFVRRRINQAIYGIKIYLIRRVSGLEKRINGTSQCIILINENLEEIDELRKVIESNCQGTTISVIEVEPNKIN